MIYLIKMLRPRSIGLLLLLVTLAVYLPATSYEFINYDDPQYVTENHFVTSGLTWTGVQWGFGGVHASNWHPLTWLSHMLDCDLFRLNPAGPHLVNILFHSVNAALLFILMIRLTDKLWPSAFVSALFAWHPLHVESVAWIAERKDVLSTFFTLLTILCYTRHAQKLQSKNANNSAGWALTSDYGLALFFFSLALLSKAMPVTLPLVMWLLDFWPLNRVPSYAGRWRSAGKLFLEKVPFWTISLTVCVITLLAQHHAESSLANISLGLRLQNAVTAYASYLGKMIWPLDLAIFYPLHPVIPRTMVLESVVILVGISALVWLERKFRPWLIVGWLWFLVTLLPVIGLVQVGGQAMADRYTYFPLVGIFLAVSFTVSALVEHFAFLKRGVATAAVLTLGLFVWLTEKQLSYWQDSATLFSHALEVEDSDVAHICLGGALRDQNRRREAMTQYILAWRKCPESMLANANIAGILAEQDQPEMAAVYYQRAVSEINRRPWANENYGRVLVRLKRYDEAMKEFSVAAQIDPEAAQPHFLMAQLSLRQGRDSEALIHLHEALKLEPDNTEILVLAAALLSADEDPRVRNGKEAHAFAEKAVRLTQHQHPAALDVLAMSYAELGQFEAAGIIQQQTIKLAVSTGQDADVAKLQKRLALYQKHQAWRDTFQSK
jgi:tetratricopeptide (TPR) repeat protein